jgi:hypothetical protein
MPVLNPPAAELGLVAPVLGPWFYPDNPTLGQPGDDLAVELTLPASSSWLPPATGTLSLFVSTDPAPAGLAALRGVDGRRAPFRAGNLVAVFRLLPEVETRLDALLAGVLGPADGRAAAPGTRARPRVRTLAFEWREPATNAPGTWPTGWNTEPAVPPLGPEGPGERARVMGLSVTVGGLLANGARPMGDLKRPGFFLSSTQKLITVAAAGSLAGKLWAFDHRGRPVDPGAVAAWWNALAAAFEGASGTLWAKGVDGTLQRTCAVTDSRNLHLVSPHLAAPGVDLATVTAGNATGTGQLRRASSAGPVELSLAAGQADAPPRRIGLLPEGRLGESLRLWPAGSTAPGRDFVRVAVADVEAHLVGHERLSSAVMQRTRVRVHRAPAPVLLAETDAVAGAVVDTLAGAGTRQLVCSTVERSAGALQALALPDVPAAPMPERLETENVTVEALRGGGAADAGTIKEQRVLVTVNVGAGLAGAWVRVWPQGFDRERARHFRMDGGAAPVRPDGRARMVVTLPDGAVVSDAPLSLDVLLVAGARASRHYAGVRFARPAPLGGAPVAVDQAAAPILVCELDAPPFADAAALADRVPAGATLVVLSSPPVLVAPQSLPAAAFAATVAARHLDGVRVELTPPAFRHIPPGDPAQVLQDDGADARAPARVTLSSFLTDYDLRAAGAPLPLLERLEVLAGRVDGDTVQAVVGSTPLLGRHHELLPHQLGHPGAPGSAEVHGTGARLSGRAAVPVLEMVRDRVNPGTVDLVTAARTVLPAPAEPAAATVWTAVLQTVASNVDGEPVLVPQTPALPGYPFGESLADVLAFLTGRLPGLPLPPGDVAQAESMARALDRRVRVAARGVREARISMVRAIERAEDFVYIETPALDDEPFAGDPELDPDADRSPWAALRQRLDDVPALRAVVCVPIHLMPGYPSRLDELRDELLATQMSTSGRVVFFSPAAGPGRSLRLASTTVIVDDVYAITGTTHLWRRGQTFDSSVAVAAFDEQLVDDGSRELRDFRRRLVAGRLGLGLEQLPDEPATLAEAIRRIAAQGGRGRTIIEPLETPAEATGASSRDAWNPDGSPGTGFDVLGRLAAALASIGTEIEDELPPAP